MSVPLNEAVEAVVLHKARLMMGSSKYRGYARQVLAERGLPGDDATVEAFVLGAADAMIYDIASVLGFTRQTQRVDDWASYRKRRQVLGLIVRDL
jgi:hypothetical protein